MKPTRGGVAGPTFGEAINPNPSTAWRGRDEHRRTGILTPDSNLAPAFPDTGQWQWELVIRYSGATVPGFHGVP